ncbi:MAG TPA: histidine kinase dimerization/phosphoacceptor domain -containing protein, partial [Emticicia sp.]
LSNLAQLYIDADKDYDKAIQIYQRAEKVNLANKNYPLLEHTYRNMGMAYSLKEDHEKAIAYGEKSVRLAETVKDPHRLFNAHGELYRSYRRKGDWENALKNVNRYRSIKDSLDEMTKSREIVTLQADFEKQKAEAIATIEAEKQRRISEIQIEAEIEKLRQIKQIESNAAVEKSRLITEINTRYETEKKEQKISELNLLNTAQNKQLQQLIIGIVLLAIFVGILSWLYSIIRNRNRDLALKNEKINQQSRQLEVLMRELHHRVKNNLGIVSGLLFLQIKFLQDEKAIKAVKEGQQRIDAMGLIHQKLYQTENIEKVNIQEFVADLVDNLIRIYGFDKNSLALDFDIDDTDLNVDIAIPLGLIINELLTNSFKYAYLDVDNPELRVYLKTDTNIVLEVADNGKGLDIKQWKEKKGSYGRQLINTLSNQIGADLTVENHHGTLFKLTIPKENI